MPSWLWWMLGMVVLLWLLGNLFEIGGGLLTILLIVALVALIIAFFLRRGVTY